MNVAAFSLSLHFTHIFNFTRFPCIFVCLLSFMVFGTSPGVVLPAYICHQQGASFFLIQVKMSLKITIIVYNNIKSYYIYYKHILLLVLFLFLFAFMQLFSLLRFGHVQASFKLFFRVLSYQCQKWRRFQLLLPRHKRARQIISSYSSQPLCLHFSNPVMRLL